MRVPSRLLCFSCDPLVLGLVLASALAGCELIADFDSDELQGGTTPVRPLPVFDGAVGRMPDGSVRDAALVTDRPDAASADAAVPVVPAIDAGN